LRRWWGVGPIAIAVALLAIRACAHTDPLDRLAPAASEPRDPPGTTARAGSLDIARGGPVVIGFQSDRPARLTVGGHEVLAAAPSAPSTQRFVLPHGPIAIRVAGDARLVWSPVGRRGDPEYVPASSLSPDPPEAATFEHAGAAPLDGVIALGLLVTLVGTLLMLARRRLATVPRATWLAMGAVFVAAVVIRWIDLGGFGQAWDEDVNWASGRNYVTNLVALDFSDRSWIWNFEHPPVMKLLDGIGAQLADGFGPARALSAIWMALGCALLVPIGARLYRLRVGILAGGIAALLPQLVAHGQIVGHESPTVLWWSLGIVLALGVYDGEPDRRTIGLRLAAVGACVGIALASRFVNGLLGPLCGAIVVIQAPVPWRRFTLGFGAAVMTASALLTFYLVWPRLWLHAPSALAESFKKLEIVHSAEPFLGAVTNHPPPYYFLAYLSGALPIGVLVAALIYGWRAIAERSKASLIVVAWFVIPLGVALSPVRQDGVRYVMPCLTAVCLMAAAGVDWLALRVRWRQTFTGLAAAVCAYLAVALVLIHPYYLDYFGEQVGGPGNVAAHQWFETAWWGEGVDRAVDYVNEHAAPSAHVYRDCIEPAHLAWFREDLWTPMTRDPRTADWIVAYAPTSHHCVIPPDAREVFSVTDRGLTLVTVFQRP
jgi:4-amino-4-deoxy-L-arabinose transferase-like glycosyltransferase